MVTNFLLTFNMLLFNRRNNSIIRFLKSLFPLFTQRRPDMASTGIIGSVSNYKGGVGKTTTTINLGTALSIQKKKVLIIDGDPQSDCTRALLKPNTRFDQSLYQILDPDTNNKPNLKDVILSTIHTNLYILPNIAETAGLEIPLSKAFPESNTFLREEVREYVKENFDYTLIDCPPTLSIFVNNALFASDFVMIPMDAGSGNSLEGIKGVLELMGAIQEEGYDLKFLKILINRVDRRMAAHKANILDAEDRFGEHNIFKNTIPTCADFSNAETLRSSTIFSNKPKSKGASAFRAISKEFLKFF